MIETYICPEDVNLHALEFADCAQLLVNQRQDAVGPHAASMLLGGWQLGAAFALLLSVGLDLLGVLLYYVFELFLLGFGDRLTLAISMLFNG
jgi:hypothetical protein